MSPEIAFYFLPQPILPPEISEDAFSSCPTCLKRTVITRWMQILKQREIAKQLLLTLMELVLCPLFPLAKLHISYLFKWWLGSNSKFFTR